MRRTVWHWGHAIAVLVGVEMRDFGREVGREGDVVEDILAEYRAASKGKVVVERFNPEPDSDAEDSAQLDNVEGQMTNTGEKFYLGLAVSFLDQKAAIPVLSPDRERLLRPATSRQ